MWNAGEMMTEMGTAVIWKKPSLKTTLYIDAGFRGKGQAIYGVLFGLANKRNCILQFFSNYLWCL
jgi:hypothetical protein